MVVNSIASPAAVPRSNSAWNSILEYSVDNSSSMMSSKFLGQSSIAPGPGLKRTRKPSSSNLPLTGFAQLDHQQRFGPPQSAEGGKRGHTSSTASLATKGLSGYGGQSQVYGIQSQMYGGTSQIYSGQAQVYNGQSHVLGNTPNSCLLSSGTKAHYKNYQRTRRSTRNSGNRSTPGLTSEHSVNNLYASLPSSSSSSHNPSTRPVKRNPSELFGLTVQRAPVLRTDFKSMHEQQYTAQAGRSPAYMHLLSDDEIQRFTAQEALKQQQESMRQQQGQLEPQFSVDTVPQIMQQIENYANMTRKAHSATHLHKPQRPRSGVNLKGQDVPSLALENGENKEKGEDADADRQKAEGKKPKFVPRPVKQTIIKVKPKDINFTQGSIRTRFHDGRSIYETLNQLDKGEIQVSDIPKIHLVRNPTDNALWSLNNRRLYTFKQFCPNDDIEAYLLDDPAYSVGFGNPTCGRGVEIISPRCFWTELSKDLFDPSNYPKHPEIDTKKYKRSLSCPLIPPEKVFKFKPKDGTERDREQIPLSKMNELFSKRIKSDKKLTKFVDVEDMVKRTLKRSKSGKKIRKVKKDNYSTAEEEESISEDESATLDRTTGLEDTEPDEGGNAGDRIQVKNEREYEEMPEWLKPKTREAYKPTVAEVKQGLSQVISQTAIDKNLIEKKLHESKDLSMVKKAWMEMSNNKAVFGEDVSTAVGETTCEEGSAKETLTDEGISDSITASEPGDDENDLGVVTMRKSSVDGVVHDTAASATANGPVLAGADGAMIVIKKTAKKKVAKRPNSATRPKSTASEGKIKNKEVPKLVQSVGGVLRILNALEKFGAKGLPKMMQ